MRFDRADIAKIVHHLFLERNADRSPYEAVEESVVIPTAVAYSITVPVEDDSWHYGDRVALIEGADIQKR